MITIKYAILAEMVNWQSKSMNLNLYARGLAQPLITQGVLKRIKTFLPEPQIRNYFGNINSINLEQIQILQSKTKTSSNSVTCCFRV